MNETDEINDKRQFVFGCLLFFTIFSRGGGGEVNTYYNNIVYF